MYCSHCGYKQDDGKFCDMCGKPLKVPQADEAVKAAAQPTADETTVLQDQPLAADETTVLQQADQPYQGYAQGSFPQQNAAPPNYSNNSFSQQNAAARNYSQNNSFAQQSMTGQGGVRTNGTSGASYYANRLALQSRSLKKSNTPLVILCAVLCAAVIGIGVFVAIKLKTDDVQTSPGPDSSQQGGGYEGTTTTTVMTSADTETQTETSPTSESTGELTSEQTSEVTSESESAVVATEKPTTTTTEKASVTQTTTKKSETTSPKPSNAQILSAAQLAQMTTAQVKAIIGNNYKAVKRSESYSIGTMGITSDYFPNVVLCYNGLNSLDDIKSSFDAGSNYVFVNVFSGGYLGDNSRVGDRYGDMIVKVNCLGAVSVNMSGQYYPSRSIIGGSEAILYFDSPSQLESLAQRYGSKAVDACQTASKCACAQFIRGSRTGSGSKMTPAAVTASRTPITIAPYADASHMWNINSGTSLYVGDRVTVGGVTWYEVTRFTTPKGVIKIGYIKASDVRT